MTIEQAKLLERITNDQGNQECDVRENYSGRRGMYGKGTAGIVVDSLPQLLTDVLNYVSDNIVDGDPMVEWGGGEFPRFDGFPFRMDNMGRSTIIY